MRALERLKAMEADLSVLVDELRTSRQDSTGAEKTRIRRLADKCNVALNAIRKAREEAEPAEAL